MKVTIQIDNKTCQKDVVKFKYKIKRVWAIQCGKTKQKHKSVISQGKTDIHCPAGQEKTLEMYHIKISGEE